MERTYVIERMQTNNELLLLLLLDVVESSNQLSYQLSYSTFREIFAYVL